MSETAGVNSGHRAEVFRIQEIKPHRGADRLELVEFSGWSTVVKKGEYKVGDLAVFVPPDSVVNIKHPPFSFLADRAKQDGSVRIKAIKLRGEPSFGLVVPAPEGAKEGEDLAVAWGIEHYNPPAPGEKSRDAWAVGGENAIAPRGIDPPRYDLENFRRYGKLVFEEGEPVLVQEKADGQNSRYVFQDGQFYCGSRENWKREYADYSHLTVDFLVNQGCPADKAKEVVERVLARPKVQSNWWRALRECPPLERFLRDNPGTMVWAELYGSTNCIKYQLPEGNRLGAFDLWKDGSFVDMERTLPILVDAGVPAAYIFNERAYGHFRPIPFSFEAICELAEGPTMAEGAKDGTIREGVVVSSTKERRHPKVGRAKLKAVGAEFLSRYR